jgi:halocyanin-like protein
VIVRVRVRVDPDRDADGDPEYVRRKPRDRPLSPCERTLSDSDSPTRRSVVLSMSALALGGLSALAGCSGGGDGGASAFDPPALRVSTGTTVVWERTGQGAQHNVVDEGGAFESELSAAEGVTVHHDFASSGTVRHACTPHRALGMKGVVIVG